MSSDSLSPVVGRRLRAVRRRRGLSIEEAAQRADLSASFLSLVERGKSDLSLGRLSRLLRLYGASFAEVLPAVDQAAAGPGVRLVRAGHESQYVSHREEITAYLLVTDRDLPLVPAVWVYEAGGSMEALQTNPSDTFSHVLEGSVVYESEAGDITLDAGDTIYVAAGERYRFRNDTAVRARVLGCGLNLSALDRS